MKIFHVIGVEESLFRVNNYVLGICDVSLLIYYIIPGFSSTLGLVKEGVREIVTQAIVEARSTLGAVTPVQTSADFRSTRSTRPASSVADYFPSTSKSESLARTPAPKRSFSSRGGSSPPDFEIVEEKRPRAEAGGSGIGNQSGAGNDEIIDDKVLQLARIMMSNPALCAQLGAKTPTRARGRGGRK